MNASKCTRGTCAPTCRGARQEVRRNTTRRDIVGMERPLMTSHAGPVLIDKLFMSSLLRTAST